MKVIFTKHAEDKFKRPDIKKFSIKKSTIKLILRSPRSRSKTKYGDFSAIDQIDKHHDVRVIYDIMENITKVITFHISRKGRYE